MIEIRMKSNVIKKVALKTILSNPLLVKETGAPQTLPNPVPFA